MRAAAPALSLLLCCTASANAQQPEPDCRKAVTQMDLNICADQDYRAADAELNKTYRLAVAAMQATDKELGDIDAAYAGALEALKKAQRAWIGYRDGQCNRRVRGEGRLDGTHAGLRLPRRADTQAHRRAQGTHGICGELIIAKRPRHHDRWQW